MNLPAVRISNDPVTSLAPDATVASATGSVPGGVNRTVPPAERAIAAGPHFDAGARQAFQAAFGSRPSYGGRLCKPAGVMRNRTDSRRGTVMTRTVNRALRPAWERT